VTEDLEHRAFGGNRARRASARHAAALAAPVAFLIISLAVGCSPSPAPLRNDPESIFARTRPGTVLIWGDISGHVSVSGWGISEDAFTMADKAWAAGKITTDAEWSAYLVDVVASDPDRYLVPHGAAPRYEEGAFSVMGSGFIVDPDGFIVTNAHVAALTNNQIADGIAEHGLEAWQAEDERWIDENLTRLSDEDADTLLAAVAEFNAANMEVTDVEQTYLVYSGTGAVGAGTIAGIPASVVAAGEMAPGKDVAVLKVEAENLPTVPLGDDRDVGLGDEVFAIGFPYDASFSPAHGQVSFVDHRLATGRVTARRSMTGDFEVIEMDAAIVAGNSGGPVLDGQGKAIGVATFYVGDEPDSSFIMPATVVNEFLDRAGAEPRESEFTMLYNGALAEEAAGRLEDALAIYRQIDEMSPGNPYVRERIAACERSAGPAKEMRTTLLAVGILIAFSALVVLSVVWLLLMLRRRKKAAKQRVGP